MTTARISDPARRDPAVLAPLHFVLRFAAGVTAALILSEFMGWQPTFLAPTLTATLLVSLPGSPPFKIGVVLVVVMALAAFVSFLLPSLLSGVPQILLGAIGLIVFLALLAIANERAKLPATLLLLCMSTVPVIAMVFPAQAGFLPIALVRATAIAMIIVWCMYAVWPSVAPRAAPPPQPNAAPVAAALMGTAVVMPMMLVYLLFGLADALPVLVTTVLLVANLDPRRGAAHGAGMMLANLAGGFIGVLSYLLLQVAPSLLTLTLITFLLGIGFAVRIGRGGPAAAIALMACNASIIILSSAIASEPTSAGLWLTRLSQFALACIFAVGMMSLVWRTESLPKRLGRPADDE